MNADYILVCSPMRTGSTFVYNFFRECTTGYSVKKYEISPMDFKKDVDFAPVVFRHPLAVISSFIDFLKMEYNPSMLSYAYERTKLQFEWAQSLLVKFPECTSKLLYEDFYNNVEYLAEWTKTNLNYECNPELVTNFKKNYTPEKVKLMKQDYTNLLQENHVSDSLGDNESRIKKVIDLRYMQDELINLCRDNGYEFE